MSEPNVKIPVSFWRDTLRRLLRRKPAVIALLFCLLYLGMALFAEGYGIY